MRNRTITALAAAGLLLGIGLTTACEPPPPRAPTAPAVAGSEPWVTQQDLDALVVGVTRIEDVEAIIGVKPSSVSGGTTLFDGDRIAFQNYYRAFHYIYVDENCTVVADLEFTEVPLAGGVFSTPTGTLARKGYSGRLSRGTCLVK